MNIVTTEHNPKVFDTVSLSINQKILGGVNYKAKDGLMVLIV